LKFDVVEAKEHILKNDRNLRRNLRVTNDIAGSVGRSAPIIRAIARTGMGSVNSSVPVASQSGSQLPVASTADGANNTSHRVSFPSGAARQVDAKIRRTVMMIADEFTAAAFSSEWNQIQPDTTNWKDQLDNFDVSLLFIESAWEGNNGA